MSRKTFLPGICGCATVKEKKASPELNGFLLRLIDGRSSESDLRERKQREGPGDMPLFKGFHVSRILG